MIDNYDEIMNQWGTDTYAPTSLYENDVAHEWSAPCQGSCTNMMEVIPAEDFTRWAVHQTVVTLANSDYYYTKDEVNSLLEQITASAVTREQVQAMINAAIADKADKSQVDEIAAAVSANTAAILNRYTKQETDSLLDKYLTKLQANSMFANYSKVEGTTIILNNENITV